HVGEGREPDRAMAVELHRASGRGEVRAELAHGVRRQKPAWVLEVEATDVGAVRERRDPLRVVGVRVHRADRVGQPDDDLLDALLAGDPGAAAQRLGVVRRLRELEAPDAVADDAAEGEPHHVLVARLPGDEPHPGRDEAQERAGGRGTHQPDQLPRVLAVEPHGDRHVRAGSEVERVEADALEGGGDREGLARREAGRAPEALVPVAGRGVDDLDRAGAHRHAGITRKSGCPNSTASAFSTWTSAIVPTTPAGTEFIIFITSITHTIVSRSIRVPTSTNGGAPGLGAR